MATGNAGITFGGDILGTDNGEATDVVLNTSGNVSVKSIGANGSTADGNINDVTIDGATITLNGTISTAKLGGTGVNKDTDLGVVDINGNVALGGATTIDTSATGNDAEINISGTVDNGQALVIKSGSGAVVIGNKIGAGTALSALTINASASDTSSGKITLSNDIGDTVAAGVTGITKIGNTATTEISLGGTLYRTGGAGNAATTYTAKSSATDNLGNFDVDATADVKFQTTDGAITFATAKIELNDGADLTINPGAGNIIVNGIVGTSHETVLLTTTGTVEVGAGGIGSGTTINDVNIDGSTITLKGDIVTAGTGNGALVKGDVDFDGSVVIRWNGKYYH